MSNLITKKGLVEVVARLFACIIFLIVLGTVVSFFLLFGFFIPNNFGRGMIEILLEYGFFSFVDLPYRIFFIICSFLSLLWADDILFRYSHKIATTLARKSAKFVGILFWYCWADYLVHPSDVSVEQAQLKFLLFVILFPILFGFFMHRVVISLASYLDAED